MFRKLARSGAHRLLNPPAVRAAASSSRPVDGWWSDGWLASVSRFASAAIRSRQPIRLRGAPAVDCCLTIEGGENGLIRKELFGGVDATIEFVPAAEMVILSFDAFQVDSIGRKLAFLVSETNLFSEAEL